MKTARVAFGSRAHQAVERYFFRSAPPHPLALFRIGFGAFLLLYWGLKFPHVSMLFSGDGIVLPLTLQGASLHIFEVLLTPPSAPIAHAIFVVFLASLVMLTVGIGSRMSALIAFTGSLYYWGISLHLLGSSFDRLFIFIILMLAFARSDRAYSVAMLRRHGSFLAWEPACVLPQRILALQIAATYLGVGWQKLYLPDWQGGEILAVGFAGRWATPAAFAVLQWNLPMAFYDATVDLIKGWEFFLPLAFFVRKYSVRWIAFATGMIFHMGIALFLAIWWFLVLIPAYIVFLEPEEVREWMERHLRGRQETRKIMKRVKRLSVNCILGAFSKKSGPWQSQAR